MTSVTITTPNKWQSDLIDSFRYQVKQCSIEGAVFCNITGDDLTFTMECTERHCRIYSAPSNGSGFYLDMGIVKDSYVQYCYTPDAVGIDTIAENILEFMLENPNKKA